MDFGMFESMYKLLTKLVYDILAIFGITVEEGKIVTK